MAFLKGFGTGLAMIVFLGPVFFTLLKTTLNNGLKGGMLVAAGIIASDIICVFLCSFGAIPFFKNPDNQLWLGIAGFVILCGLGLKYLFKPAVYSENNHNIPSGNAATFFAKGFVVNFVNPFVFLVWIGVIGFARMKYGLTWELAVFLFAVLLAIFTTDILKVVFAHRIKSLLKPEYLRNTYRVIGIVLIIFGVRMLWKVL